MIASAGRICHYCGARATDVDHLIPIAAGGLVRPLQSGQALNKIARAFPSNSPCLTSTR